MTPLIFQTKSGIMQTVNKACLVVDSSNGDYRDGSDLTQ